jgi:hypothetical protein
MLQSELKFSKSGGIPHFVRNDNSFIRQRLSQKLFFTPKPPKGGFISHWFSISPPWGI